MERKTLESHEELKVGRRRVQSVTIEEHQAGELGVPVLHYIYSYSQA